MRFQLNDPIFIFSHVARMAPLCRQMRAAGFPLVHICMDYPEPYQYELIALSDKTLVIPKAVFHKLKSKFGEKINWIPQSIHLPTIDVAARPHSPDPVMRVPLTRPRLGYLGPMAARVNMRLLRKCFSSILSGNSCILAGVRICTFQMHIVLGGCHAKSCRHSFDSIDVGVMPYDCFEEKNLHCVPLKLFDYFLEGLPVVSTPAISLWEFSDLIYFGDTAERGFTRNLSKLCRSPHDEPEARVTQGSRPGALHRGIRPTARRGFVSRRKLTDRDDSWHLKRWEPFLRSNKLIRKGPFLVRGSTGG